MKYEKFMFSCLVKVVNKLSLIMRGKLIVLFCLFALCLPVFADTIKGSVSYTEENARKEAFEGVSQWCPFPNIEAFHRSMFVSTINYDDVLEIQEFHTKLFKTIPYKTIAVIYKNQPNFIYHYSKGRTGYKGEAVDVIEKNKTIKYYSRTGKLLSIAIYLSGDECYVFDNNGKTLAHWIDKKEYYTNATRKIIYAAQ